MTLSTVITGNYDTGNQVPQGTDSMLFLDLTADQVDWSKRTRTPSTVPLRLVQLLSQMSSYLRDTWGWAEQGEEWERTRRMLKTWR